MIYKDYNFPGDLLLISKVFWQTLFYRRLVHRKPLPEILADIIEVPSDKNKRKILDPLEQEELDKINRAANFLLLKILHVEKPCLPRSLVLFRWCSLNAIEAKIIIGVKKAERLLQGHSWLLIEGKPYHEDLQYLEEYTIMLEGSN